MSLVRELPRFSVPGHCIMFPGRRRDERGFYLFDVALDGPNGDMLIGISAEGLRTIAGRHGDRLGIAKREDLDEARTNNTELRAQVEALEARVAELEDFKEHLAGVAAEGFDIKKRLGRPNRKGDE